MLLWRYSCQIILVDNLGLENLAVIEIAIVIRYVIIASVSKSIDVIDRLRWAIYKRLTCSIEICAHYILEHVWILSRLSSRKLCRCCHFLWKSNCCVLPHHCCLLLGIIHIWSSIIEFWVHLKILSCKSRINWIVRKYINHRNSLIWCPINHHVIIINGSWCLNSSIVPNFIFIVSKSLSKVLISI